MMSGVGELERKVPLEDLDWGEWFLLRRREKIAVMLCWMDVDV